MGRRPWRRVNSLGAPSQIATAVLREPWLAKLPFMYAYFLDSSHGVVIEKLVFDQRRWMSFPILLPRLPEQLRITEILDSVDHAISRTERLITKLDRVRQGMLDDLLTRGIDENGELRDPKLHPAEFKESAIGRMPRQWRVGRFGDVARGVRGVTYKPEQLQRSLQADSVILLRANNIQGGEIDAEDIQIVPSRLVSAEQRVFHGDIVVCMSNGSRRLVGKSAQCTMSAAPLTVGAFCSVFHPQGVVPNFLLQLFQSSLYKRQVELTLAGSAINNLRNRDIETFDCALPPMKEQERIATALVAISMRTELEERGLRKLRRVKQGLMEDLLTGRVRVTQLTEGDRA